MYRVVQANLQGSYIAQVELGAILGNYNADVVLIQHPYVVDGGLPGLDGEWKLFHIGAGAMAAIGMKKEIDALFQRQLTSAHHVVVSITGGRGSLVLVSSYFQYREEIDEYLRRWEQVIVEFRGQEIVLAGDVNAKSPLWFSGERDWRGRGEKVEDLIAQHQLHVCNREGELPTYRGNVDERRHFPGTNIDLTLLKGENSMVEDWTVIDEGSSDHRIIVYDVKVGAACERVPVVSTTVEKGRYLLRKADWRRFGLGLRREMNDWRPLVGELDGENLASRFMEGLLRAAEEAVPRATGREKVAFWWSTELQIMQRAVRKKRKNAQRERDPVRREWKVLEYRRARNEYFGAVREAKRNSWRKFVTEQGNKDPWGIVYRLVTGKKKEEVLLTSMEFGGGMITDKRFVVMKLLDELLPDDDEFAENEYHKRVRKLVNEFEADCSSEPITEEEIGGALASMKKGKAPGFDGVTAELVKAAYPHCRAEITQLFNKLLGTGVFPKCWKQGVVKVLYKGQGKDPVLPKSYRPLTLLPVMGKLYEKVMFSRIYNRMNDRGLLSEQQYGFRPGRGTEDAVLSLLEDVRSAESNYVLCVFLDISGAFDGMWWPSVLWQFSRRGVTREEYRFLSHYFEEREVTLRHGEAEWKKQLSKGCPQGSVMGPLMWIVEFDSFLRLRLPEGCKIRAYADDAQLTVEADSRLQLEHRATKALEVLLTWGEQHKMAFSAEKTTMTLLKGRLERKPLVKIGEKNIKYARAQKHLGIIVDERNEFKEHVTQVGGKAFDAFSKIRRIVNYKWGLDFRTLVILYKGLAEGILLYGASVWAHRTELVHYRRIPLSVQRLILLTVIRGYRTISGDAVCVIAGIKPIDIKARERKKIRELRKSGACNDSEALKRRERSIEEEGYDEWQARWNASTKGRYTYSIFPDVRQRCGRRWLVADHYVTQALSGHGNFNEKLYGFGLVPSPNCVRCGQVESAEHVLLECEEYEEERRQFMRELRLLNVRFELADVCSNKAAFSLFSRYVKKLLIKKENQIL